VHVATRIAALAHAGEVLVSESAVALLDGAGLSLEDAGEHELKGVPGRRRVSARRASGGLRPDQRSCGLQTDIPSADLRLERPALPPGARKRSGAFGGAP